MNRVLAKRLALLASAVLLASCAVGPDYEKPPAETPDSFKELGAGSRPSPTGGFGPALVGGL